MKTTIITIIISIGLIFGCMTSKINDSLKDAVLMYKMKSVAVLASGPEGDKFEECVREKLMGDLENIYFIEGKNFRNTFFPWFEPDVIPESDTSMALLLNKPMIQNTIDSLGVDLLISIRGHTTTFTQGDAFGYVAMAEVSRRTSLCTSIWDLRKVQKIGGIDIEFKGDAVYGIIFIIPVITLPPRTESACCNETAERIEAWLKKMNQSNYD